MRKYLTDRRIWKRAVVGGFVLAVLFSFLGFDTLCENIECKVLRLHVKANSDSEYDQQIKLAVKDKVFTVANELTKDCESMDEAVDVMENNMDIIVSVANECLEELNAPYTAVGRIDESYFGTRDYGEFSLPAGEYMAVRIDLGSGEGQNWWCAVYPALCTSSAVKYDSFTEDEKDIITSNSGGYEVRFKLYELYRRLADILAR